MIFVTIGTQKQNFNRLFNYVNQIKCNEEIIVQKGNSKYKFNNKIKTYDYLSYDEMDYYFNKARIIITHAGAGTIFRALSMNKKVIVVPRLKKYKEHINDHQLHFSSYLKKKGYCLVVNSLPEFNSALKSINNYNFNLYTNHEEEFTDSISEEINKLLEK